MATIKSQQTKRQKISISLRGIASQIEPAHRITETANNLKN